MTRDRIAEFFQEKTARRGLELALFLGLILVFRKLLVLLAFFVIFERALFFSAGLMSRRFRWGRGRAFAVVAVATVAAVGLALWLSAGRVTRAFIETRDTLPEKIATLKENALYLQLREHLPDSEKLVENARLYGVEVAKSAAEAGHLLLVALIGLVLAVVYFFEEKKLRDFAETLQAGTLFSTLTRWLGHLAEAVSMTVQLQLIVAACNTLLTLPVLLILGIPHVAPLMLLIFVSSLIPVLGNLISGAVLVVMAYQTRGLLGVGAFVSLTFVLHKVEAYYLNPRLTARHVKLPGFVLILSLIAWEHLLGFVGLFVSFPFLFVAGKILQEFRAGGSALAHPGGTGPLPASGSAPAASTPDTRASADAGKTQPLPTTTTAPGGG